MIITYRPRQQSFVTAGAGYETTWVVTSGALPLVIARVVLRAAWRAGVVADQRMRASWIQAFSTLVADSALPVEWRTAVRADARMTVDVTRRVASTLTVPLSWVAGVLSDHRIPIGPRAALVAAETYRSILRLVGIGSKERPTDYAAKKRPTDYRSER